MQAEPVELVECSVLGPLRVRRAGADAVLGGPRERALLALLLVRAGQPVAVSEIVGVLWGPSPPRSAENVIRRHMGSLRRLLEPGLTARAAGRWLARDAGGYRWTGEAGSLDLTRFRRLREQAGRAAPSRAVELLTEALDLWRGPVAAGLPPEMRERAGFGAVERERQAAVREVADAALDAGVPEAVLARLREAAADHPLDEPLLARLILALAAAGRRAEALGTYRAAVARLADELGIDPGAELRDAHRTAQREPARVSPVPAQLPHDLPTFTGRQTELDDVLGGLADQSATVVITAIDGMAGIGKTTLAVHWAHRIADRFPDGQLYVNLRGFDPSGAVMGAGEAVRLLLDALGVPPERVPHGLEAQGALYRSVLAGRRVLVLLDNARDSDQLRPLLPGTPGCLTVVTSRRRLPGLVAAHGAHTLTLRPLDAEQARAFLARRLGAARLLGESRAVDEITELCAGLPLALACVAARAAAHPHFPLPAIAAELRAAHGSLDAFSRTDTAANVGAVFSWSLAAVSPGAARLFRLLGLHPGPDVSAPAAAALTGLPVRAAHRLLAELAAVHLAHEHAPGRYTLHDLLRAHAAELVGAEGTEDAEDAEGEARADGSGEQAAALERLYAYYLHTAHAAHRVLAPHARPLSPGPVPAGVAVEALADDRDALDWLAGEYPVLQAVLDAAARSGRDRLVCVLAWSLEPFFDRRGHWHDGLAAQRAALEAASRLSEPGWEARGLLGLARAEGLLGLHDRSCSRLARALELFTESGERAGQAEVHRSLGWHCDQQGDLPGALRHNQRALELFRAVGGPAARASVLNSVGWYHALLGQYRQALSHCFEALAMLQELGDRYGQASTWDSIAYAHHGLRRHPHALLGYHNALVLYRELGVPYLEACTLVRIGDTHLATGAQEEADSAWRQALALLTALDHPDAGKLQRRLSARADGRDLA
ncbi:BTAD domain-containing putative transcriptional regulator [Streptomyces sp. NPDC005648]|uniref:AfsR/SARP family transcriptional regulator n=1 Tax=Streptomyces sp. NPDC005648 TaxID=3157044 RepID=UPI0033B6CB29